MKQNKWLKITMYILIFILIIVFIIKMCPVALQNDTLYDIKLGQRYLHSGIFRIDDYSFHSNLIYQTHHYLVCIIDYLIYSAFSFKGLYILEVVLLSIIFFLIYSINKTMLKNKFLMLILTFVPIVTLSSFISLRAQMYSYILLLLEILMLEKYLNNNKKDYLIILAIIPLLLINFHSGVIYMYFIIMGTYLLNRFKIHYAIIENDKRMSKRQFKSLIITSIIGASLTLINPYGVSGITYGLKTLNSYYITHYIAEFQPFDISKVLGITITLYFIFLCLCLVFSRKTIKIHEILLILGTFFMTTMSIRHFSLLIITSIVIMPHVENVYSRVNKQKFSFIHSLEMGFIPTNIIIVSFYIFIMSYLIFDIKDRPNDPLPSNVYPIKATAFIKNNIPSNSHILNQYFFGSYLMFNDIKVFVDSRCDLYNEEYNKGVTVFKDYIQLIYSRVNYKDIVSKYDIDYFMFNSNYSFLNTVLNDLGNIIIYRDSQITIIKVNQ